ncbi:hypothetical protein, partial [Ornithinimicrobium sp. CNJ-824]|uniref:hypothetical protein n=1 Tax=Ornithinimicrobium sp. CNJ-824 TaxID=1904966 RepID=UPI001EDB7231
GEMGQALLLLLLVEPDWLKDLPLAIPSVRQRLGRLCVAAIRGEGQGGGVSKWAASALLRAVSKEVFLDSFALLFMACNEHEVRWELILGMHTLSSRPYHQTQGVQSRIAAACLDAQSQILPHEEESGAMIDTLQRMERSARSRERAATRPTMQSAWQALRRDYRALFARHPAIAGDALIVVDALDGPSIREQGRIGGSWKPPGGWDSVRAAWRNCSDYIGTQVVPNLPFVRPIIEVYLDMENSWGMRRRAEVLLDSHEMSLLKLQTLDRGMEALENDTLGEQDRNDLADLFRDWFASVLEAPVGRGPTGDAEDAAYLYRALERCPANVEKVWAEARTRLIAEGTEPVFAGASIPADMVFCDRMVLRDALVHVMENVYSTRHRGRRRERRVIEVSHKVAKGQLVLEIKNTGTEEAEYPGQGMSRFDGLLGNFGGSLKGSPSDGRPFTYVATLVLPLWNGVQEEYNEDASNR